MKNDRLLELKKALVEIVGQRKVLTDPSKTRSYRTGIRVGNGNACAVVLPMDLVQFWRVLNVCISFDKIVIVQAANTGLTGGSTPYGDEYDRDVVIINTLRLDKLTLLKEGKQVLAWAGSTLYKLEQLLEPLGRGPHSLIGSSCIGASIVGGICNNSGGNLVNRGPAYTELSLFARLTHDGRLELVNHLGIELGNSPEEMLTNLQLCNFNQNDLLAEDLLASDNEYHERVRDINSSTPARFNADQRRLFESSGCAGKIAVFAVRLDTFPKAMEEKVFFIGTNKPHQLSLLRRKLLSLQERLPDMGEYMHRSYFDGAYAYCKDTFLIIKYLGTSFIPTLFGIKRQVDLFFGQIPFLRSNLTDVILQKMALLLPPHLTKRVRDFRDKYEHYMIVLSSDSAIDETRSILESADKDLNQIEYFECEKSEGDDLLLHRYVAGSAPSRFSIINSEESGKLLPLDIALPRNCDYWHEILPQEILSQMTQSYRMGHFLCMVFHWDFVLKKEACVETLKSEILNILDNSGAKYPAEHNFGHLYKADSSLVGFYQSLDPTNSFNPGIGKTSKNRDYG